MTADPQRHIAQERFAVSHTGMQQIHAGRRPPCHLLKELVQYVWDEAPEATLCQATIRPAKTDEDLLTIRVEDDGTGFANVADAWTLMGHTPKRSDPNKGAGSTWAKRSSSPWQSKPPSKPWAIPYTSRAPAAAPPLPTTAPAAP